jgi:hypothetical protein
MHRLVTFVCVLCLAAEAFSADRQILFGTATTDITPQESIRLNGYSSRTASSDSIVNPLEARVLVLQDAQGKFAFLLTLDLVTIHAELAEEIAGYVWSRFQVPRERLLINASHTHTGPVIHGTSLDMSVMTPAEEAVVQQYTTDLESRLKQVISAAMQALQPGRLRYAVGTADFAMNRRIFAAEGVKFGFNPDGPVDHEVPVLAVVDSIDAPRAIVFGYACHATTLGASRAISSDYMGFARAYLESVYPEATSFFVQGCCGDINPYPRGTADWAKVHGLHLAGSVVAVLSKHMHDLGTDLFCAFETIELEVEHVPTLAELQETLAATSQTSGRTGQVIRMAAKWQKMLQAGHAVPAQYAYPVQVWRFGEDLTWVALAGEVTVDYAIRLKRELAGKSWISAYSNDVPGYVGSMRILLEGG